ncbi:unnamed protein product, partial [Rotaria magnacalcarata]
MNHFVFQLWNHFHTIEAALCHIYVFQLFSFSTTTRHDPSDFYRSARNNSYRLW